MPRAKQDGKYSRLSYSQAKIVEDLLRTRWNGNGYKTGHSDETLALEASKRLRHPIIPSNIRYVRRECRLHVASPIFASRLSQKIITRLERIMDAGIPCVITPHGRLFHLEKYVKMQAHARSQRPWLLAHPPRQATEVSHA